jgi:hypothetical protein
MHLAEFTLAAKASVAALTSMHQAEHAFATHLLLVARQIPNFTDLMVR